MDHDRSKGHSQCLPKRVQAPPPDLYIQFQLSNVVVLWASGRFSVLPAPAHYASELNAGTSASSYFGTLAKPCSDANRICRVSACNSCRGLGFVAPRCPSCNSQTANPGQQGSGAGGGGSGTSGRPSSTNYFRRPSDGGHGGGAGAVGLGAR